VISVVKEHQEPGISLVDLPVPVRAGDDVLIRVDTVGICGSDLHAFEWIPEYHWLAPHLPAVLGHEITGTIVEARPDGVGPQPGQRVVVRPAVTCGVCEACQRGESQRCSDRARLGYERAGGLAEFMVAPSVNAYPIPEGVDAESAALTEPLTVAVHALSGIELRAGSRAAVVGPGAIGLLALQLLTARGAREVLVVGTAADRDGGGFGVAEGLGGVGLLTSETTAAAGSCDVVVVTAGAGAALDQAIGLVKKGGVVVVIALGIGAHGVDMDRLVRSEVRLVGSFGSVQKDWLEALELLGSGLVRGGGIVSHWLPLSETRSGFTRLLNREARKVIIRPGAADEEFDHAGN
jgi:threonine dehydrogenase-like Zn-dependent dehydrogenase